MICVLEIKNAKLLEYWKKPVMLSFFRILISLMFPCTYIVLNSSSSVIFSVIFATRASIICIDSGTCDAIRISFALAIRFFNISINRYTPTIYLEMGYIRLWPLLELPSLWDDNTVTVTTFPHQYSVVSLLRGQFSSKILMIDTPYRHATSPCEHGDLRFLHPFFVLSPYSQLSPYFTHFPEKILICTKPV